VPLKALCLLLVLVGYSAQAQVYRSIGPDGQTTFSDRPLPNAEQLDLLLDVAPAEATDDGQPVHEDTTVVAGFTGPYELFSILAPPDEYKTRDLNGELPVSLVLAPTLQEGHQVMVEVNGIVVEGDAPNSTHLLLRGLTLGSHRIRGLIKGPDSVIVAATPLIGVHVLPSLPASAELPSEPATDGVGTASGSGGNRP
jgi:hypothetical protein